MIPQPGAAPFPNAGGARGFAPGWPFLCWLDRLAQLSVIPVGKKLVDKSVAPRSTSAVVEGTPTAAIAATRSTVSLLAPTTIVPAAVIPAVSAPIPIPIPATAMLAPFPVPMVRIVVTRIVGIGIARVRVWRIRVNCPRITVAVIIDVLRSGRARHYPHSKRSGGEHCAGKYCAPGPACLGANAHS
jgi:hypothetical protein